MDEETQTLLTQWKMDDYIELFKEKPESNQSGVAVENAKEFSDVSDFILNINNELEDLPLGNYKIATTTEKRVQKVWSNKQKVIIIVNSSALTYYLESVSSDNALFEFEDSSDLLQWLENCTDPWDTVESHWIRTAGTRLKLLLKDFDFLYPSSNQKLWNNFPIYKQNILNAARKKLSILKDVSTKSLLRDYLDLAERPPVLLWSMRFEAKHRTFKIAAQSSSNRKNICKTLAIRQQQVDFLAQVELSHWRCQATGPGRCSRDGDVFSPLAAAGAEVRAPQFGTKILWREDKI
ncbi:hypothetical protein EVAR_36246_1 [Eumeta japonica]|uniref:Uncharacterized protein n=1 Tax=Eumeta variegata TaxID=151549 RepID=A0A4C1WXA0_EUMVA|nr:hypothetical protein EVAR_36246_1 [Eumeta japonica]